VGLPTGATFVGNVFSWTPTFFQSGIYTVTFIASDGVNTATQIVTITVVDTNGPPQFSGFNAAYTINEGQFLAFTVTATDPEGLPVTLTVAGLPFGATFAGNVFSWTPNFAQAGVYVVTFTASDGMLVSTTTVTITVLDVTPPAGNRAPILDRIGDKLAFIGKRLMFLVTGSDPDGDTIMFSASSLPKGASFIGNTFDWTPGKDQEGTYKVRFTVSDGALSDSELIEIDVEDESFDITLHMLAFPDGDEVAAGDQLLALVNLQNEGNVEIDDVRIRAYFMDEGLTVLSDAFDLDPQEQASRLLTFDIPVDMAPGEYYVGFSVRNADVTRVVYREIEVV
jgi:PKD repeat protein